MYNRLFNITCRYQFHITFRTIARSTIGFIPFAFHQAEILMLWMAFFPSWRRTFTGSHPSKEIYQTFHGVEFL